MDNLNFDWRSGLILYCFFGSQVCLGTRPELDEKWDPKSDLHAFQSFISKNHHEILTVNVNHHC